MCICMVVYLVVIFTQASVEENSDLVEKVTGFKQETKKCN